MPAWERISLSPPSWFKLASAHGLGAIAGTGSGLGAATVCAFPTGGPFGVHFPAQRHAQREFVERFNWPSRFWSVGPGLARTLFVGARGSALAMRLTRRGL